KAPRREPRHLRRDVLPLLQQLDRPRATSATAPPPATLTGLARLTRLTRLPLLTAGRPTALTLGFTATLPRSSALRATLPRLIRLRRSRRRWLRLRWLSWATG